jgi:MscS family membrane protein
VAFAFPIGAQVFTAPAAPSNSNPQQPLDPLGRSTPRSMVSGLVRALNRDDFVSATRFMQISVQQHSQATELARDLKDLMDRYFKQPLATINDSPSGSLDDGLPLDQERIGPLTVNDKKFDLVLVRIQDAQFGAIWLVSSSTLAEIPALHQQIEGTWIERAMPGAFSNYRILGISLAQGLAWLLSLGIPLLLAWYLPHVAARLLKKPAGNHPRRDLFEAWFKNLRVPTAILVTLVIHLVVFQFLGFSLSGRILYSRFCAVILIIVSAWLVRRILKLGFERALRLTWSRGDSGTGSLIMLGKRLLNLAVTLVAIFAVLTIIGIDTKTALAGIGIGGVALALGAQKSVENLLGGISLLTDKAIAVGDSCTISDRRGTVEDITLRSIRLRTTEQTVLSIPAGTLSQGNIENFSTRTKSLLQSKLLLRYGTTAEQLTSILVATRKLLDENRDVETDTARIRLTNFGLQAIEVELFAYILTAQDAQFFAVREDLLLHIAAIVESCGSGFARPTEFVYMQQDTKPDGRVFDLQQR